MNTKPLLAALLCLSSSVAPVAQAAPARSSIVAPKPGSPLRKAILHALRGPVEKEMKQAIVFYNVTLRVKDGWAYVATMARDTKGRKLKRWAPEVDPLTAALLRRERGRWRVLYWDAATDASPQGEMRERYPRAPRSLFPSMPSEFPGDGPMTGSGFNNRD